MEPLTGGLSSEIYRRDDGRVVRMAPEHGGLFPDYDLARQGLVQEHVAGAGIPAPAPVSVETVTDGRPGLVMPFVVGHVPGPVALNDPWLAAMTPDERGALYRNFLDVLASIHRLAPPADLVPRDEPAWWSTYLDWSGAAPPRLRAALEWCRVHRPAPEPEAVMLWGDVRLGNVVFRDDRSVAAVLDWEMAGAGAPEHDAAWLFALESVQDEVFGRRPAGFPERPEAIAHYESRLGRPLRPLAWYETLALVRSTAIMGRLQRLSGRAVAVDPLLGIIERRIASQQ